MKSKSLIPRRRSVRADQAGFFGGIIKLGIIVVLLFGSFNLYQTAHASAVTATPEITSTIEGYCMDDLHDSGAPDAVVDSWSCNGTAAQEWSMNGGKIRHNQQCLAVLNNGAQAGDLVVADTCSDATGQNWTINQGGFENPNSSLCLVIPDSQTERQLVVSSCNNLSNPNEGWEAVHWGDPIASNSDCQNDTQGQHIACIAEQQWALWQSGTVNHGSLINTYSDGNGYEEWCADFVSYVYKQAGYPFVNGERNGWDEYNANNIVNMGFTVHSPTNYIPKPGDVAYFNYPGGHVEIVVEGGVHPTFIYGDSGTTDPKTNNGEMNEDMITTDGQSGQIEYYLSPN